MHPGGVRSAMHLFNFEKSANLKHPNAQGHEGQLLERKYCKTLGHGDAPSNTKTRRYCKAREY